MKILSHDCGRELKLKYPGEAKAKDGERWKCSCGKVWEHVCDEAEGCYWVPRVKVIHDEAKQKAKRKRLEREAQRVWAANTGKDVREYPVRGRWKNRRKVA